MANDEKLIRQVRSDGGAITGAQASIYARAKAAIDQSLPLLEALYPLSPDADRENLAAVTASIRLGLTELVDELGRSGGPRPQRVDSLFDLILADYDFTLWLSWRSVRTYFDRVGEQVFLGPQLVLLSRALAVVAESVQETYLILDSVFVGPAERATTRLHFKGSHQVPLTLAELLQSAERFAAEEAPRLISEAGKDGVIAFRPTLERLVVLFQEAVDFARNPSTNRSAGVHSVRVVHALDAIRMQLASAERLTRPLSRDLPPKVEAVEPAVVTAGDGTLVLDVEGENFQPRSLVWLDISSEGRKRVEPRRIHRISPTLLRAIFDLCELGDGEWTVVVTNPDGARSFLERALCVGRKRSEQILRRGKKPT